ncbi:hypothetical protein OS493_001757 [Desmophyllum pertusum]|uniref:Gamma-glutamyltranspeptidase 1 n=1 Tax=Desmophyllum pertusum TaxID=174260 RepID=A0A9X0CUT7_9CNID|nr:hypothetical protein OS493_001757 [Desmophyllum pertusum]
MQGLDLLSQGIMEGENTRELKDLTADEKEGIEFGQGGKFTKKRKIIVAVVVVIVWIAIIVAVVLVVVLKKKEEDTKGEVEGPTEFFIPPLATAAPPGADGPYSRGVVAADAPQCSEVGRDILKKNGSAVDSAIATLFCIGVINMHSAGIGGGGFMVVYNRTRNFAEVFDYRERAPGKANTTMYVNSSLSSKLWRLRLRCAG